MTFFKSKTQNGFVFILTTLIAIQCSRETEKTLYKNKGIDDPVKYIKYSGSEKREYFLESEMINDGVEYYYNIRFLQGGKIMHVLKYESRFIGLGGYGSKKHFLVTDTVSKWGPNYFGEGIKGYYDPYVVNNFLSQPHPPKTFNKVSFNESLLFNIIDSVTNARKIKFDEVLSNDVLGWFKYDF